MYFKYLQLTTGRTLSYTRKPLFYSTYSETVPFHCKKTVERKWQCLKLHSSNFHTTPNLRLSMSFGSLVLCMSSMISGHYVRKWWLKQTPMQQEILITWYTKRRRIINGSLGFITFLLIINCLLHMERDPVMNKLRFVLFDSTRQKYSAQNIYNVIVQDEKNVVPLSSPLYKRVAKSVRKLKSSNKEFFEGTDWTVTIIHQMFNILSYPNVLILPDRNIIIFADIFNFVKNDDQLTFILAHEMAHELLLHPREELSYAYVGYLGTALSTFFIWIRYARGTAALISSGLFLLSAVGFSWYGRRLESEADKVGLKLSAKTCVDMREVFVFWEVMKKFQEINMGTRFNFTFLKDHPSFKDREKMVVDMMPELLELRTRAKCHKLPDKDPRDNLPYYLEETERIMGKRRNWGMRL